MHCAALAAGADHFHTVRAGFFGQKRKTAAVALPWDRFAVDDKVTGRVLVTTIKSFAVFAGPFYQFAGVALRANHIRHYWRFLMYDEMAGREVTTANEHTVTTIFYCQSAAATGARCVFQQLHHRAVMRMQILNISTGRVVAATEKRPVFAGAHHQLVLTQRAILLMFGNGE